MTDEPDYRFAERVRATSDQPAYGTWRAISGADAVPLAFGFPFPDALPDAELESSVADVLEVEGDRALQYGGGEYADRLASVVAERAAQRGVDGDVVLTTGASEALDLVCRAFLDPGDAVVVEEPTFMGALSILRGHGADLLPVPVDADGLDVDALADLLADRRAAGEPMPKFVYVVPNFQNPTGATLAPERRERLVELAAEYDLLVVSDDPYGDLRYEGAAAEPLASRAPDRVLRLGSFSKTIAPGVRTGWVVAPERVADQLDRIQAGGPNTLVRSALARYVEAGHLEDVLQEVRSAYAERRTRMLAALAEHMPDGTEWTEPEGGFFVWVDLPDGVDADAMLEDALEAGVAYIPGSMFYVGDGGENQVRLSFSHATPDDIEAGVERLASETRRALEG